MIKRIFKEPLLHFLIVGGLLFAIFDFLPSKDLDDAEIIVGDDELVGFILARDPRLNQNSASQLLVSLDKIR